MSKDKISDYSATANSNTDIAGINIDEGCAPSGINNAIRTLMKQIKDLYAGTSGDKWPVTAGGTGGTTASEARTNLGLAIGTDVQAYDAQLTDIAGLTPTDNGVVIGNGTNFVVESGATLKTSLGLTIGTDVQAYDADLTSIANSGKGDQIASYGTYGVGFKNRIINGAMMIDQRNAGASVTVNSTTGYVLDRWTTGITQNGKLTSQQNAGAVTPPVGFKNYLGFTSTSAYSVLSTDIFAAFQKIEGFNTADLAWGTANAATVTISFWVRSSLTGTFGGALNNALGNRSYLFTYTISAANTWEQKTITVAGDTSGTWATDNSCGIQLNFGLGGGSTYSASAGSWQAGAYYTATGATSVVGTSGATFYITGVQLEKGSTATSFDYRPYGTELALCQRYYQVVRATWSGNTTNAENYSATVAFQAAMRSSPTGTSTDVTTLGFNAGGSFTDLAASGARFVGTANTTNTGRIMVRDCLLSAEL
jgi:hypothetical protein